MKFFFLVVAIFLFGGGPVSGREFVNPEVVRTSVVEFREAGFFSLEGLLRTVGEDLFNYRSRMAPQDSFLRVFTATEEYNDGRIFYYSHLPYQIRPIDQQGWQRVRNRISRNDERPALIRLPPGRYVVRTPFSLALVTTETGYVTDVILPENRF